MKFVKLVKASEWKVERRHHDTENGEDYYYIWGPEGEYCDADGEPYRFDSREDALEEVEYLKAEHKFDKKSRNLTRSEIHNKMMNGIFEYKNKIDNAKAEFLKSKGLSEEELEYLKKNTGLGRDALDEKLIELGLHKEFWNTQKNASKKVTSKLESGKWYKINGNPLSLQFTGETTRSGNLIFVKADGTQVVLDPSVEKFAEEFDYEKHNKIASKKVKSGESYGWYVAPWEAQEKLDLWVETVGVEQAFDDLRGTIDQDELSECLAYIFRNNDFKEGCSEEEEDE